MKLFESKLITSPSVFRKYASIRLSDSQAAEASRKYRRFTGAPPQGGAGGRVPPIF